MTIHLSTKYSRNNSELRRREFIQKEKDKPVVISGAEEPEVMFDGRTKGPRSEEDNDGPGIAYPPDDLNEDEEDDIPGSGLDALRNRGGGIRITKDEIRGGDGRIISRRTWD